MSEAATAGKSTSLWQRICSFFTGKEEYEIELENGTRIYRRIKIVRIRGKYIDVCVPSCRICSDKISVQRIETEREPVIPAHEQVVETVVIAPPPVRNEVYISDIDEKQEEVVTEPEKIIETTETVVIPEVKPEETVEPEVTVVKVENPAVVKETEKVADSEVKKPREKKETPRALIRFPGVTSIRTLYIIAKNSAAGADAAYNNIQEIKSEIEEINKEASKLRTPSGASDAVREELARRRADLKEKKKYRNEELNLANIKGKNLEVAADEYAFLIKYLNNEVVNYRKTPRFNEEVVIRVTDEDLKDLKDYLFD